MYRYGEGVAEDISEAVLVIMYRRGLLVGELIYYVFEFYPLEEESYPFLSGPDSNNNDVFCGSKLTSITNYEFPKFFLSLCEK